MRENGRGDDGRDERDKNEDDEGGDDGRAEREPRPTRSEKGGLSKLDGGHSVLTASTSPR